MSDKSGKHKLTFRSIVIIICGVAATMGMAVFICGVVLLSGIVGSSGDEPETENEAKIAEETEEKAQIPDENKEILQQKARIKELDVKVTENREDELVFTCSLDEFIESFNGYYWKDKGERYLLPAEEWNYWSYDTGIHSKYETVYYNFSADENISMIPLVSAYVPSDADYIQEITVDFDQHGFSEGAENMHETLSVYAIKTFLPELEDEKIKELYSIVYDLAYEKIMPVEAEYKKDPVPRVLYYKGNVGIYPFFSNGGYVRICIIPVTEERISYYRTRGTETYSIESL